VDLKSDLVVQGISPLSSLAPLPLFKGHSDNREATVFDDSGSAMHIFQPCPCKEEPNWAQGIIFGIFFSYSNL
jgi:hypothetical protein